MWLSAFLQNLKYVALGTFCYTFQVIHLQKAPKAISFFLLCLNCFVVLLALRQEKNMSVYIFAKLYCVACSTFQTKMSRKCLVSVAKSLKLYFICEQKQTWDKNVFAAATHAVIASFYEALSSFVKCCDS